MSEEAKPAKDPKTEEMWPELSTHLRPLLQAFQKAPFAIAPERRDELKAMLGKLGIFAEVIPDDLSMWGEASILIRRVRLGFPSMERLWAYGYGVAFVWIELQKSNFEESVSLTRTREGDLTRHLLRWAIAQELGHKVAWPDDLPRPDGANADPETVALANEIFWGSVAFIILHEIGHIILEHKHDYETPQEVILNAEYEADEWAYDWIMDRWRESGEDPKNYIKRSMLVAAILSTLAGVDFVGTREVAKITHPNPIDRLLRFLNKHADEGNGLPWVYPWFFSASAVVLHLTNCDDYDMNQRWDTSREFLQSIRHHFDKQVVSAAPVSSEESSQH